MPIKKCDGCKPHAFQDEKYGKGVRVYTGRAGTKKRCTVCGKLDDAEKVVKK